MATRPQLVAQRRTVMGKKVRSLRRQGILPANVYGYTIQPTAIQLNAHEVWDVLRHAGSTQLIDLTIEGTGTLPVLVREIKVEPVRNVVEHIEFYRPNLRQAIQTTVPLHFVGESPAVQEGGILLPILDHVQIESLPTDVPAGGLQVDISGITEINGQVHAGDIQLPPGVTLLTPADEVVAKVNPPTPEEVVEEYIAETEPLPTELGGENEPADAVPEA